MCTIFRPGKNVHVVMRLRVSNTLHKSVLYMPSCCDLILYIIVFLLDVVSPVVKVHVGTEVTSYSVSEDIGVVELCIVTNIVCPDADTISVSISTSAGSAGIIIRNNR